MPIKWADANSIKQPKVKGLIEPIFKKEDWILGASPVKHQVLQSDGQWDNFLPVVEIQRTRTGDTFCCVSFSHNNCKEILHKRLYGYEINIDDRFLGVGSGTVRGQGNSPSVVAEWSRKNGFIKEGHNYPEMTLDEFYKPLIEAERDEGIKSLDVYESSYEFLPRNWGSVSCTNEVLKDALQYAPIQVSVGGYYQLDSQGRVIGGDINYTHEVLIFGWTPEYWKIFDSESEQFIKFRPNYLFGWPLLNFIHLVNKPMLVKKNGASAIYVKHWSKDLLIPFSAGVLEGGDLFKSLYGITEYSQLPRMDVDVLPFPVADYGVTTSGMKAFDMEENKAPVNEDTTPVDDLMLKKEKTDEEVFNEGRMP